MKKFALIIASAMFIIGCGGDSKDTAVAVSASSASSGGGGGGGGGASTDTPMELMGEWNGPKDDDHKLVFGPAGVQSTGIICTRNLSFVSIQSTGQNRWKFATDDSQIEGGVILKMPDGTLNISAKGSGCYAEGMTGIFRKGGAVAERPERLERITPPVPAREEAPTRKESAKASDDYAAPVAKAVAVAEAPSPAGGLGVGSRVSCNWKSLGTYYNGTIKRKNGSKVFIKYDDGDEENTRLSKCRALGGSSAGKGSSGGGGADTVRVNIKVKMKRTKDNGKNWDAFGGEPDIAICIDSDSGFQCYPDGDSVNGILSPECQDSFRCTFRNVPVPKDGFELIVVDVDLAANDVAGSEECRPRGTCNVGRAKATITRR